MWPTLLILVYCLLVVAASLAGGWLPSLMRLTHVRMQIIMSFVSGLMLGVALLHMMPHAAEFLESAEFRPAVSYVAGAMLSGVVVMFFLLRMFDVHHHGELADKHHAEHDHDHHNGHRLTWTGLLFGLVIHSLLDGVAVGASVVAEADGADSQFRLFGFATFMAVLLHKPLDALAITSTMQSGGWSNRHVLLVNGGFSLTCPLGALVIWFSASQFIEVQGFVIGIALAFSAGFFLCIALSDLLPEVAFHSHDRIKLFFALILGVMLAVGIELLPHHSHDRGHSNDHSGHHHHDGAPENQAHEH